MDSSSWSPHRPPIRAYSSAAVRSRSAGPGGSASETSTSIHRTSAAGSASPGSTTRAASPGDHWLTVTAADPLAAARILLPGSAIPAPASCPRISTATIAELRPDTGAQPQIPGGAGR